MTPIPIPYSDAVLRWSLPFPGLNGTGRVAATAALLILFILILRHLYKTELRSVPRRVALLLLAVRVAAFAVLFAAVALDPVVARSQKEEIPGKVLIAIDLSESMTLTDANRPLTEKLRLAAQLNLVSEETTAGQLEAWAVSCEVTGTPRFGAAEQAKFEAVCRKIDAVTRLTLCERLLTPRGSRLLERLREKHAVEVIGFGRDVAPLPTDTERLTAALTARGKQTGVNLYTDLKLPLGRAAELSGNDTREKLIGVVLLTDGRHNWGESPVGRARDFGTRGVPISSVPMAPTKPPSDIAVVAAHAQASTVFKGSLVPIDVGVRVTGMPAGKVSVLLEYPAAPDGRVRPPLTQTIDHDGKDATYPLTFKAKMEEPGPQLLTVTAKPNDKDSLPDNNKRTARVNVVKDRAKVLIIDGESRWEFHYLHTCLGRDPNMDVRSVVFRQPRIGRVNEEDLRKSGTPAKKLPDDLDVLTSYDCVILGDVEPEQMTTPQREAVEKYVAEGGGTLVLTAGKRAMPLVYSALDTDPFRKLLPVRSPVAFDSPEGFPLNISPEGERSWFLAMGDTPNQNRMAWDRFPPHHWAAIGPLKDGAEVLAAIPGGPARERAVLARQNYGFGRVLYVGIDSTWRWRYKTGDYFHHRFWGQVAQWAASDRLLPVTNASGTIRFGTREPIFVGGQDVDVVVRTSEAVKKLGPNALKGAKLVRLPEGVDGKETPAGVIPLTHPDGRPRDLVGKRSDLAPGRYVVELDVPDWADQLQGPPGPDGRAGALRCPFEVTPPDHEELVEVSANLQLLEDVATQSGGKVYPIPKIDELIESLTAQTATRETFLETPFRRSWWLLGVFIGLVALEWVVRKLYGLP